MSLLEEKTSDDPSSSFASICMAAIPSDPYRTKSISRRLRQWNGSSLPATSFNSTQVFLMPTETIQTVIPDMSYDDREYVIFDDGDGPQIMVHDKHHGVLESLPPAPEDPT